MDFGICYWINHECNNINDHLVLWCLVASETHFERAFPSAWLLRSCDWKAPETSISVAGFQLNLERRLQLGQSCPFQNVPMLQSCPVLSLASTSHLEICQSMEANQALCWPNCRPVYGLPVSEALACLTNQHNITELHLNSLDRDGQGTSFGAWEVAANTMKK